MDHGNGTKTYFADGQSKNVQKPTDTIIGSPGNLLSPDRYEFYTFDETGDLVKRLMTLEEIHGLIAGTDPESVIADASPTYYHDALSSHSSEALMHLPASDLESLDAPAVHKVLESVQNVLKNEMAANSGKPVPSMPSASLHRPDSASAWSSLFPGLIETPDDVAHLSGYLLPSKTNEPLDKPQMKKPSNSKTPLTSIQPSLTTVRLPSTSVNTLSSTTTEKVRSTPKYTTVKPELTTKFSFTQPTSFKTSTTKKPFSPMQSFDKPKPSLQKPTYTLHPTSKPTILTDNIEINKEMSASISDMLSQVTDNQSSNNNPLQTNTLVEKDNTADYIPEESSPELSYYSPVAMPLSTNGALKPVTEALVSAKRPITSAFKTTTTEIPFSQKTTSTIATRFGPTKYNTTKSRPSINTTTSTSSYMTKPVPYSKYNGTTVASTTRNNYQYPPSNMSTKYMQKITQTTQAYPNKLIDSFVKVVNKTINNATLSIKQPPDTVWNSTGEIKNKFNKEPNKVFQNKVISARPNGINRTNVTLSNRIQELKTTAMPNFGVSSSTTTRSQTEPDKFVSVKVEEWPMTAQHHTFSTSTTSTTSPSIVPYVSTEKSFYSSSNQPLNAITDPNAIRELISSLMTKPTTASSSSTSTALPTTISAVQTIITPAISTTSPTPLKLITGIPASLVSSTTEVPTTTLSTTTTETTSVVSETTTATMATTLGTSVMMKTGVELPATGKTAATSVAPIATSEATTTTVATTVASTSPTTSSTTASSTSVTPATKTTTVPPTTVTSTTPESETQYVAVTHFLPELQVKDRPEIENNNSTPGVDLMLKDGISAVASMLQNTQKPSVLNAEYQEMGERPYDKVALGEGKQPTTEQARKQSTIKVDNEGTTTMSDNVMTQELYEFTTASAESITRVSELNDTIAMESVNTNNTEEISRNSESGSELLTVFNISSTGVPGQVAKLTDLSAETQTFFDVTTPFDNHVTTTDSAIVTEETIGTTTFIPTSTTASTTTIAKMSTSATAAATAATTTTVAAEASAGIKNATNLNGNNLNTTSSAYNLTSPISATNFAPGLKTPGQSSNAYRPALVNSASPSTVELHPAPHESMGLEASIAFLGDDVRRFADLCNELSFKMWTAVTGKGQIASRSLVLSPFELTAMLAMVFLGARGSTSGQMNDILRLDDMVTFNPHQVLRNITHSITNINNPGVATASFVREIYSNKVTKNICYYNSTLDYMFEFQVMHLFHQFNISSNLFLSLAILLNII